MPARSQDVNPSLKTPLCSQLGIDLPIVQAPMAGGWTTPALVAAVCNAGGLGMLAAARFRWSSCASRSTRCGD